MPQKDSAEKAVRDIRRKTRQKFSAEEKIRIVIEGRWISLRALGISPVGSIRAPEASPIPWEAHFDFFGFTGT